MCQRAILLNGGKIAADGDALTLFKDRELMDQCGLDALE
jgi:hypothetical protein